MLNKVFGQVEKLQDEAGSLSNIFSNILDDLINSFYKKDIINHCQIRNATNPQLPAIGRNSVVSLAEIDNSILGKYKDTSHSKIKK